MKLKFDAFTPVTWLIILINGLVFSYATLSPDGDDVTWRWGLTPFFMSVPDAGQPYHVYITLITHAFVQVDKWHFFWNAVWLWMTGSLVEASLGWKRFSLIYFGGGAAAIVSYLHFASSYEVTPLIGSSGCVAAVMGAYLGINFAHFKRLFGALNLFVLILMIKWLFDQVSGITGTYADPGVGYWAHVGGFAFGLTTFLFISSRFRLALSPRKD